MNKRISYSLPQQSGSKSVGELCWAEVLLYSERTTDGTVIPWRTDTLLLPLTQPARTTRSTDVRRLVTAAYFFWFVAAFHDLSAHILGWLKVALINNIWLCDITSGGSEVGLTLESIQVACHSCKESLLHWNVKNHDYKKKIK